MSEEIKAMRRFLSETREKAEMILQGTHLGADVKTLIQDLLTVGSNLDSVLDQNTGQSADARVLKKKLEVAKTDLKNAETKIQATKQLLVNMVEEVKIINLEVSMILKRLETEPQSPNFLSAGRIRSSVQKMVEIVKKASGS